MSRKVELKRGEREGEESGLPLLSSARAWRGPVHNPGLAC
jgi:hypothetical protein